MTEESEVSICPTTTMLSFSPDVADAILANDVMIAVTGAGGWFGQATLEMIEQSLGVEFFQERVRAFGSRRRVLQLRSGSRATVQPLDELECDRALREERHLLAHYAFLTREHTETLTPSVYLSENRAIADLVTSHANRSPTTALFVPSSGAVYGSVEQPTIDFANNPYGSLKAADEDRFLSLGSLASRPTVVVFRVFNLAGPFLNKPDRYALGSILLDIMHGGPIRLSAAHPVVRSYVHVRDVIELAFASMVGAESRSVGPIDTAGEREVEVGELARIALEVLGRRDLPIVRPPISGPADHYAGDPKAFADLAASYNLRLASLEEQIADTAAYLGIEGVA